MNLANPGYAIAGYTYQYTLGEGSYAKVHAYMHTASNEIVAIKINQPDQDAVDAARVEIAVLKRLQNAPNIVRFREDVAIDPQRSAIVLDYVAGITLNAFKQTLPVIPDSSLRQIASGVLQALAYLRSLNIVYGDMTQYNIMLQRGEPVLIDFGFAMDLSGEKPNKYPTIHALEYRPPEAAVRAPYDPSADIWAFAALIFHICTDAYPFPGGLEGEDQQLNWLSLEKILQLIHHTIGEPPSGLLDQGELTDKLYIRSDDGTLQLSPTCAISRKDFPEEKSIAKRFDAQAKARYPGIGLMLEKMLQWTDRLAPKDALQIVATTRPKFKPFKN